MSKISLVAAIALTVAFSIPAKQQPSSRLPDSNEHQQHIFKQIQSGDRAAILAAGASGDLAFVPYLKKAMGKLPVRNDTPESDAQMALARLDQPDELKTIACELQSQDPVVAYLSIRKASYVGGWATVQSLQEMLTLDEAHARTKWGPPPGDALYPSSNELALRILRSMFPEVAKDAPKPKGPSDSLVPEVMFWKEWISVHEAELRQKPPLGADLPQIKAATEGQPDTLDLHRLCH